MSIPVFAAGHVHAAVDPADAVEAVREAFVAHARGEWLMPSKVYVPAPPDGDFRAMPARGGGYAALKWVTSFPGNPERGLPTVSGIVLLSDAADGRLLAQLDAGAVTALRTGAAAVLAAETWRPATGRPASSAAASTGARWRERFWPAAATCSSGTPTCLARPQRPRSSARARPTRGRKRSAQTSSPPSPRGGRSSSGRGASARPARQPHGRRRPRQGGDRRRGARASRVVVDEWEQSATDGILSAEPRVRLFCDEWDQASHGGDIANAFQAGKIGPEDVTQLGDVLTGEAQGRQSADDITIFDSTGLAVQDLAVAALVYERATELGMDVPTIDLSRAGLGVKPLGAVSGRRVNSMRLGGGNARDCLDGSDRRLVCDRRADGMRVTRGIRHGLPARARGLSGYRVAAAILAILTVRKDRQADAGDLTAAVTNSAESPRSKGRVSRRVGGMSTSYGWGSRVGAARFRFDHGFQSNV